MTNESEGAGTGKDRGDQTRGEWIDDAQDALQRAGDAIRAAWDASKPARMSALDAARQAARQLDDALERGMSAARERWEKPDTGTAQTEQPAPEPADNTAPASEEE